MGAKQPRWQRFLKDHLASIAAVCFLLTALAGAITIVVGAIAGSSSVTEGGGMTIGIAAMFGLPMWAGYGIAVYTGRRRASDERFDEIGGQLDEVLAVLDRMENGSRGGSSSGTVRHLPR